MSWRPWPKTDSRGLARYVLPSAATRLPVPSQPATLPNEPSHRRALIESLYAALLEQKITYRAEAYQPEIDRQIIRPPAEILGAPRTGTCLDLAALFCGVCLGHDLLPLLIVLNDHAFVAVSLTHGRSAWRDRTRRERAFLEDGVLDEEQADLLRELIADEGGEYLPIECTGFSRSESMSGSHPEGQGRAGGVLTFERAIEAAREQLSFGGRCFEFAIDVAGLHDQGYMPPPPLGELEVLARIQISSETRALRLDYFKETADILQYYGERFVAREEELAKVHAFLRGDLEGDHRSYLLIEAPGGRGKSALMVSLIGASLSAQWPGAVPHVVFYFIRRQGAQDAPEAFLRAVNSQLLTRLGFPGGTASTLPDLRSQFQELWSAVESSADAQAPFLLLVDGLDAMARTEDDRDLTIAALLPTPSNPHVKVIVSSRPQPRAAEQVTREHPLARAHVLPLHNFDATGIRQVLESIPVPESKPEAWNPATAKPAEVEDVARRIRTLTDGEPLFARFICEEAIEGGLRRLAELEATPPSDAEDYFRRELVAIRKCAGGEESWSILGTLSVARGPLSHVDLASITEGSPRAVRNALAGLLRFLLGEERFEFMHARLAEQVASEFSAAERRDFETAILRWCEQFRSAGWPKETPQYVLENYLGHLVEAGRPSEAVEVLDRTWLLRKRERTKSDGAFVADADYLRERIVRAAHEGHADAHSDQALALLQISYLMLSYAERSNWLIPEYIEALAAVGRSEEAATLCLAIQSPKDRADALLRCLASGSFPEGERVRLLEQALTSVHASANQGTLVLIEVADRAAALGQEDIVLHALHAASERARTYSATDCARALAGVAGAQSRRGNESGAMEAAQTALDAASSISSPHHRHIAFMLLAESFARGGLAGWAETAASAAERALPRDEMAQGFAVHSAIIAASVAAHTLEPALAEQAAERALRGLRDMKEGYLSFVDGGTPINTTNRKAGLLPALASAWCDCGRPDLAAAVASEMEDPEKQEEVRLGVASVLAMTGEIELLPPLFAGVSEEGDGPNWVRRICATAVVVAASRGRSEEAFKLLESLRPDPLSYVALHSASAVWLARQDRLDEAKAHAARATEWSTRVEPFEPNRVLRNKVRCFVRLASELARGGCHEDAAACRAAAARAAEAATETFVPIVLAELVPERSAVDADPDSPVFERVKQAVAFIADSQQREGAANWTVETFLEAGWIEKFGDEGSRSRAARLKELLASGSDEEVRVAIANEVRSGQPIGSPRSFAGRIPDDLFRSRTKIPWRSDADLLLPWYRELLVSLVAHQRTQAACDIAGSIGSEPSQWMLVHSLLDAHVPDANSVDPAMLEQFREFGLPDVPAAAWLGTRAIAYDEPVSAEAARDRLLELARSGRIGPIAAAVCGRVARYAGGLGSLPTELRFRDKVDREFFEFGLDSSQSPDKLLRYQKRVGDEVVSAIGFVRAAEHDFDAVREMLGLIPEGSEEWPRARSLFVQAARKGALEQCLPEAIREADGSSLSAFASPPSVAATALAEAGFAEEAIELADSVQGEWSRPGTLVSVCNILVFRDELGSALRVAALDHSLSGLGLVLNRAGEIGDTDTILRAFEFFSHPTYRLKLFQAFGEALAQMPPQERTKKGGDWILPDFVKERADWFAHVSSTVPLLAEAIGPEQLQNLSRFLLRTEEWLNQT